MMLLTWFHLHYRPVDVPHPYQFLIQKHFYFFGQYDDVVHDVVDRDFVDDVHDDLVIVLVVPQGVIVY